MISQTYKPKMHFPSKPSCFVLVFIYSHHLSRGERESRHLLFTPQKIAIKKKKGCVMMDRSKNRDRDWRWGERIMKVMVWDGGDHQDRPIEGKVIFAWRRGILWYVCSSMSDIFSLVSTSWRWYTNWLESLKLVILSCSSFSSFASSFNGLLLSLHEK